MSQEEPVPTPGKGSQLVAAGHVIVPRVKHFAQSRGRETGLGQTMFDLERLPELLSQTLVMKLSESEIVMPAIGAGTRAARRPSSRDLDPAPVPSRA